MPTTPPGFLILDEALAAAGAKDTIVLDGDEGRHAAKVARIGVGETILLTDAPGRQARAEVITARKETLELVLLEKPSEPARRRPQLTLVQALATGGRDEQAVESATELGVDRIVPWMAQRSVSVWRGEKLLKGRTRWENTVRAAVKQCRRPGIPVVTAPVNTAGLVTQLQERADAGSLVFVLHEQESVRLTSFAQHMEQAAETGIEEIIIIVGPEGGISEQELEALTSAGARSVLLGPEVLRSSTAGPAALAVLSALTGRWS